MFVSLVTKNSLRKCWERRYRSTSVLKVLKGNSPNMSIFFTCWCYLTPQMIATGNGGAEAIAPRHAGNRTETLYRGWWLLAQARRFVPVFIAVLTRGRSSICHVFVVCQAFSYPYTSFRYKEIKFQSLVHIMHSGAIAGASFGGANNHRSKQVSVVC